MPGVKREKLKILVVEDDFMVRQVIRDIVEPYDLICMDIMMPVMDGNQALIQIRDIEKGLGIAGPNEVKAIMVTALDEAKTVVTSYSKGGATSYIVKSIEK